MTTPSMNNLISRLITSTETGRIDWTETGLFSYQFVGSGASVFLRCRDGDGLPPFIFAVLNDQGEVVDSIEVMASDETDEADSGQGSVRGHSGPRPSDESRFRV
jgi:hypothetical protein